MPATPFLILISHISHEEAYDFDFGQVKLLPECAYVHRLVLLFPLVRETALASVNS